MSDIISKLTGQITDVVIDQSGVGYEDEDGFHRGTGIPPPVQRRKVWENGHLVPSQEARNVLNLFSFCDKMLVLQEVPHTDQGQ